MDKKTCCLLEQFEHTVYPHNLLEIFHRYQLVFNEEEQWVSANKKFFKAFKFKETWLKKSTFKAILSAINPKWEALLPQSLKNCIEPVKLPWEQANNDFSIGFQYEVLESHGFYFTTLIPILLSPYNAKHHSCNCQLSTSSQEIVSSFFCRLRLAESRLNYYLGNFPGMFFFQKPDLCFDYLSSNVPEKLSSDGTSLEKHFFDLIVDEDKQPFLNHLKECVTSKNTVSFGYRLKTSTGAIVHLLDTRTPIFSQSQELIGYNGLWIDNTRLTIAEKRISELSWKANLSLVMRGLLHDFRNVISGIFSLSELYCSRLTPDNALFTCLSEIKQCACEARQLLQKMSELSREEPFEKNYHDVRQLLQGQIELIKTLFPSNTLIQLNLPNEDLPIFVENGGFKQMVLNLALNAKDACSANNTMQITIGARKIHQNERVFKEIGNAAFTSSLPGVEISFRDNGEGIPEKNLEKIFELFFTTKDTAKGSGIGLYNTKLFVENNAGKIAVDSQLGQGSTFYIFFPLANFNERVLPTQKAIEPKTTHRLSILIYASKDPSDLELTHCFREKECEIITFSDTSKVKQFLKDSALKPNAVLMLDFTSDNSLLSLISFCKKNFPTIKLVLQTPQHYPETYNSQLKDNIDLYIDELLSPKTTTERIQQFLTQAIHNEQT